MFRRNRKRPKTIEITTHLREFLYDAQLMEAERLAVLLGAKPISSEGEDHEREMSDKRTDKVAYLMPLVHSYAHIVSEAMVKLEREDSAQEGDVFPDEFWEMMHKLMEQISMSVTIGVLSQVAELDLIKVKDK